VRTNRLQILTVILFTCVHLFSGCSETPKEENPFQLEGNLSSADSSEEENFSSALSKASGDTNTTQADNITYLLSDHQGNQYGIRTDHKELHVEENTAPVVILNFFSTWSLPCQGEAPYLTRLQKKYPKNILVLGVMLHPDTHLDTLEAFVRENNATFFISSSSENDRLAKKVAEELKLQNMFPVPLTVIYHNGIYDKHYEGAVPVEMLEHDIQILLEKGDR